MATVESDPAEVRPRYREPVTPRSGGQTTAGAIDHLRSDPGTRAAGAGGGRAIVPDSAAERCCPSGQTSPPAVADRAISRPCVAPDSTSPWTQNRERFHGDALGVAPESRERSRRHDRDREFHGDALGVAPESTSPWTLPPVDHEPAGRVRRAVRELLVRQIGERVAATIARYPLASGDALVATALPVWAGAVFDGRPLGLSSPTTVDAIDARAHVVFHLCLGEPTTADRLTIAGAALAVESVTEVPVELGCVVSLGSSGARLAVERSYFLVDDELRQWFVELRDERARSLAEAVEMERPVGEARRPAVWHRAV